MVENKRIEKYTRAITKNTDVAILMSDKTEFKAKSILKDKGYYIDDRYMPPQRFTYKPLQHRFKMETSKTTIVV